MNKIKQANKLKPVKMYTVIWTPEGRKNYDIPKKDNGIILLEHTHGIKFNISKKKIGRPKMRYADVYPFFETYQEAEAYRENNEDWMVVEVQILLKIKK